MEILIRRSVELPNEIKRLIMAQGEKKDQLYDLVQRKREIEDEVAGDVAADRQRYPNEESRRAEIMLRLRENEAYQNLEAQIKTARKELTQLEAAIGKAQGEISSVNALINLLAAAIHSGRTDIEQMITNIIGELQVSNPTNQATATPEERQQATPQTEVPQNEAQVEAETSNPSQRARVQRTRSGRETTGDVLLEAQIRVLETSVSERGNTRAWCEVVGTQQRVAVFAKNGNGEKLRECAGTDRVLKVKYRQLNAGWFAVTVSAG